MKIKFKKIKSKKIHKKTKNESKKEGSENIHILNNCINSKNIL